MASKPIQKPASARGVAAAKAEITAKHSSAETDAKAKTPPIKAPPVKAPRKPRVISAAVKKKRAQAQQKAKAEREKAAATRAQTTRERAAQKQRDKDAAYAAAAESLSANEGAPDVKAAALVLKSKNAKKTDRRRAAAVMGLAGGAIGGRNRAANLSAERRTAIAREAGLARQAKARAAREENQEKPPSDGRARRQNAA